MEPWNKGRLTGPKTPLTLEQVWRIRIRLELTGCLRDLALFNLAIDSKLRACDLVALRMKDLYQGGRLQSRATVVQKKTKLAVRFEVTKKSQKAIQDWVDCRGLQIDDYIFKGRRIESNHIGTQQYRRILKKWVAGIDLDPALYGTHTMRRTKATLLYRKNKNLREIQLLLGHSRIDSTVKYLGIDVDDALDASSKLDI